MKIVIALLPCILIAGIASHTGCSTEKARIHEDETAPGRNHTGGKETLHRMNHTFKPGPAIIPSRGLREWLNGLTENDRDPRPLIRIPVVIEFSSPHRLSIARAWIGGPGTKPDPDLIRLRLDDSGMGIPLVSIAREGCPGGALSCPLWLEGYWGALLTSPQPAVEAVEDLPAFAVIKSLGPVKEKANKGPLRAWVKRKQ